MCKGGDKGGGEDIGGEKMRAKDKRRGKRYNGEEGNCARFPRDGSPGRTYK